MKYRIIGRDNNHHGRLYLFTIEMTKLTRRLANSER